MLDAGDPSLLDRDAPDLAGDEAGTGPGRSDRQRPQERSSDRGSLHRGRGSRRRQLSASAGSRARRAGSVEPFGGDAEGDQTRQVGAPGRCFGLAEDDAQRAVGAVGEVDSGRRFELLDEGRPTPHRVLGEGEEWTAVLGLDAGRENPTRRARRLRAGNTAFENRHPRARLGEPQGGRAAVDSGADDDDLGGHLCSPFESHPVRRRR